MRDRSETRRHEASLSVRIVNTDGDVLWGETAESRGGKFRSASAEVADKIALALKASLARLAPETEERPAPPGQP